MNPADHANVVLVHGLWMNSTVMGFLATHLRRCGFTAHRYGYPSMRLGLAENAARLARFLDALEAKQLHVVAHSLGGMVTMRALNEDGIHKVRRVVLLGSPVAGSFSGRRLASLTAARALLGVNTRIWEQRSPLPVPDGVEVGVLAGNRPVGLGRLIGGLPGPHDGTVCVAETRLDDAADSVVVPVTHTQMLFSSRVGAQVCSFLRHGRFKHAG